MTPYSERGVTDRRLGDDVDPVVGRQAYNEGETHTLICMKTDPSIYTFLAADPEAFRVLTGGLTLAGSYVFRALTVKGIERRLDGLYEPQGHDGPVYVVEFQAQPAAGAWYNLLTKIGLYGEQAPERDVRGLLIVRHAADLPALAEPGGQPRRGGGGGVSGGVPAGVAGGGAGQSVRRRPGPTGAGPRRGAAGPRAPAVADRSGRAGRAAGPPGAVANSGVLVVRTFSGAHRRGDLDHVERSHPLGGNPGVPVHFRQGRSQGQG